MAETNFIYNWPFIPILPFNFSESFNNKKILDFKFIFSLTLISNYPQKMLEQTQIVQISFNHN